MTTDPVLRTRLSNHVARVRARLRPPVVLLAVLAVLAVFPQPGGLTALAVEGVDAAGQAVPTISIGDTSIVEGNGGVTTMAFTVTLDSASQQEVRVGYGTAGGVAGGTATGGLNTTVRASTGGPYTIPDVGPASTYPVTIAVSGLTGPLEQLDVAINGLTHASPNDVDMLLESPTGRRMIVLSDAGGTGSAAKVVVILKDDASAAVSQTQLQSGVFWPFSASPADIFPAPAPPGPYDEAGPAGPGTLNDTFRGIDPNGIWKAWIADDTPGNQGSIGNISLTLGVADSASDFVARFGQLVFPPGTTTQQIFVKVNGDTNVEPNETILVDLFAPIVGVIGDDQAVATILDDDGGGGTPPTAVNDLYDLPPNGLVVRDAATGLLSNDLRNAGGPMTVVLVDGPRYGTLRLDPDGGFSYSGIPGTFSDTFTYRAVNAFGQSNVASVTIAAFATVQPPTNFRVDSVVPVQNTVGQSNVTVRFDPPAVGPTPTGFALAGGVLPGQTLVAASTGSTYPIASFLAPTGDFYIRALALAGTEQSAPSNEVPLHTNTTVPPSAPENLLVAVDASAVTLAWKNTFGGGIPTNSFLRVTGDASVTVPLGPTDTFSYPAVPAGNYTFEIFNGNLGGVGPLSNSVTATFPGTCVPPQTPANFLLYTVGDEIGAVWGPPLLGPAPGAYVLQVASAAFTGRVPVSQRAIRGPVPPGDYDVSVASQGPCGESAFTPVQKVVVTATRRMP